MARMLTEEEVRQIEKQRELRDRARAAGSTAGMSWQEAERFRQDQLNERFKQAHADAMERKRLNVLANPGAEANTNYRHSVMRGEEMRLVHEHEMEKLGKELKTRENESYDKRLGMENQGRAAAEARRDAEIETAKLNTASAEKVADINKQIAEINSQRDKDVETIRGKSNLEVAKEQGGTQVDVAEIGKEGTVEAAQAQARSDFAQSLMRQRTVDEKTAWQYSGKIMQEAQKLRNSSKRNGKPTMSLEEAIERVKKGMPEPGKKREWQF